MDLSIGETFARVFGLPPEISASNVDEKSPAYQSRRWFRSLTAETMAANLAKEGAKSKASEAQQVLDFKRSDLDAADTILTQAIVQALLCEPDVFDEAMLRDGLGWVAQVYTATSTSDGFRAQRRLPFVFDPLRHVPPRMPYDVFAIAAHLVEIAGIYQHIQPKKRVYQDGRCDLPDGDHHRPSPQHIEISISDLEEVKAAADAWRKLTNTDDSQKRPLASEMTGGLAWKAMKPLFVSWGVIFGRYGGSPAFLRPDGRTPAPAPLWWKHAWRLMAIADEAGRGTCYAADMALLANPKEWSVTNRPWFERELLEEWSTRVHNEGASGGLDWSDVKAIDTLSVARHEILGVLPKVRTPDTGCTLRSLSHHLALTPPLGVVQGVWTPDFVQAAHSKADPPRSQMNLLLVPFPFTIEAKAFCASEMEDVSDDEKASPKIGYFDVHQYWLRDGNHNCLTQLKDFLQQLIDACRMQAHVIHGIVFPELALDEATYRGIREYIFEYLPQVELFISGVSSVRADRSGNFVSVATFETQGLGSRRRRQTWNYREKHHRWRLDRHQITGYGLQGALSPELSWWEDISLETRRVDFTVFRGSSVLAAMICEDLARVDPCQQIIRAVAPSLVVALLMDAPQIAARWPGRYATVLAEDPGCAVLTLTSRGLMTRQHRQRTHLSSGDDRAIAMWRDDRNERPISLMCPYDAQAVVLSLMFEEVTDVALDGRTDSSARAWRYAGHAPVRIKDARARFPIILGADDVACWS